jgi:hypothetical protein
MTPKPLPDSAGWWLREGSTEPVKIVLVDGTTPELFVADWNIRPGPGRWLPVELPVFEPLRELAKPDLTLVVVETGMGNVYPALRHADIKGWQIWKDNHWISWPFAKELTRAECEAAGYKWPEECNP